MGSSLAVAQQRGQMLDRKSSSSYHSQASAMAWKKTPNGSRNQRLKTTPQATTTAQATLGPRVYGKHSVNDIPANYDRFGHWVQTGRNRSNLVLSPSESFYSYSGGFLHKTAPAWAWPWNSTLEHE
jgi:hypothetical protein